MDDLQNKISQILSDPQAMEQLQSLGGMLGLNSNTPSTSSTPPPPPPKQENGLSTLFNDDSMQMVTKIMPMLKSIKQEDEVTLLLSALRPFLSESRQKKLDEAKKLLQIMKLLPLVKNMGLFNL